MIVIQRLIRRKLLILCLLAVMISAKAQNSTYLSNHKVFASALSAHYGIPASIILAVAAVESSYGNGAVARVLNNHFGIVGDNDFVNRNGNKSRYKQYANEYASYIDFCKMISRKRYYSRLRNNEDPRAWVKAMSRSGYSEQPEMWEKKILGMVAANRL